VGGEITFDSAAEGVVYDALLVVCGCANCCASVNQYASRTPPVFVQRAEDVADAVESLLRVAGEVART
jgi:hypothetical protein